MLPPWIEGRYPLDAIAGDPLFSGTAIGRSFGARPLGFVDIGARGGVHDLVAPLASSVAVLGFVLWRVLIADLPGLLAAPFGDTSQLLARAARPALHVMLVALAAQAAIAVLDYGWVVLRHGRGLRMSRHDILEEQKETEGDPRIRARLRPSRSATRPKKPPPSAQPTRNAAWIQELYCPTAGSRSLAAPSNSATKGAATST